MTVHVNDARAFLQNARPGYDLVVFGFLDSQAPVHLDEQPQARRLHLHRRKPAHGLSSAQRRRDALPLIRGGPPWLAEKIIQMVANATGTTPIVYRDGDSPSFVPQGKGQAPTSNGPAPRFGRFNLMRYDLARLPKVEPATDDWPFLYLQSRTIPGDLSRRHWSDTRNLLASIVRLRSEPWGVSDAHFLFLGLGFLLLETKSIGDCSLYFGSTWLVTTIVVAGVLIMVLAANMLATKIRFLSSCIFL